MLIFHDLRYAVRMLVKAPELTLTAIATLALGIGANTAIFELLDAVRLRTLPAPEPNRLALMEIKTRRVSVLAVSGTFATTLDISPAPGRLFRAEDDFRGGPGPGVGAFRDE